MLYVERVRGGKPQRRAISYHEYLAPTATQLAAATAAATELARKHPWVLPRVVGGKRVAAQLYVKGTGTLVAGVPPEPAWTRPHSGAQ